jgi:hypothetical protein
MSLNTAQLKADLKVLYVKVRDDQGDGEAALDLFIDEFAQALEAYVKTVAITYSAGLTAGAVAVTGQFNHTIS